MIIWEVNFPKPYFFAVGVVPWRGTCRESPPGGIILRFLGLQRRQLGNQTQRHGKPFQLVVRTQEELRGVVTRVVFDLRYLYFSGRQRFARLVSCDELAGSPST